MYQQIPPAYPTAALRRRYFGSEESSMPSRAYINGTSAIQPNAARHGGIGPAIGNGKSRRNPERSAINIGGASRVLVALAAGVRVEITGIYAESKAFSELVYPHPALRYNPLVTALLQFGLHLLTVLFFVGLVGSAGVVVLSFIEDLGELFGEE